MTTMKAGVAAAFSGLHFYDNPSKGRVYLFTAATAEPGMIFCKKKTEEKIIYFLLIIQFIFWTFGTLG